MDTLGGRRNLYRTDSLRLTCSIAMCDWRVNMRYIVQEEGIVDLGRLPQTTHPHHYLV